MLFRSVKREEDIEGYFIQATAYSIMAEELTGLSFPQIVIIMSVDHDSPLVFVKRRDDYIERTREVFA